MSPGYDAVIVGGGPAGLATALATHQRGLRVVVIDKSTPPIDKACGEGLMPSAVAALRRLGVELNRDQCMPFFGIRYLEGDSVLRASFPSRHDSSHVSSSDRGSSPLDPPRHGLGMRRLLLHEALHTTALNAGIELRWGCAVTALRPDGIETADGLIHSRFVVGADGLHSRLRRWARLEAPRPSSSTRPACFGIRRHYAVPPWSDHVEVHWTDRFEAYVTPVSPDSVGVAWLCRDHLPSVDDLLRAVPQLCRRLHGAAVLSDDRGAGPLQQRCHAVTRDNLALVGDAAGYLDAITGEGLSLAFQQAESLAAALTAGDLSSYAAAHRRIGRLPTLFTHAVLALRHHPRLRRRLFALATPSRLLLGSALRLA